MRIVIANTAHFRGNGVSNYLFDLSDLLAAKGHQTAFFAMQDDRNQPDQNSDLFASHIDFRKLNQSKGLAAGFRVMTRAIYSRESRRKFSMLLDRFQPDLVHLHSIHAHITPSVLFEAKKRGLPVVWTLHDYKLICPNTHLIVDQTGEVCEDCRDGRYYRAVLRRCKKGSTLASCAAAAEAYAHRILRVREKTDIFLSPSRFLQDKLIARGFPTHKVRHLPPFVPEQPMQEPDRPGYLLFLGRLEAIKGVHALLKAAESAPEVRLILAGRPSERLAQELPTLLPPNAEYVGVKHGEDLWKLVHGASAMVVPSLWYENQPLCILEAFACGRPVIASNLGGMAELAGDGERGLLVEPGDIDGLAEAMRWITDQPAEAARMGQEAQGYARAHFGAEQHYGQLMNIYGELLAK